MAAAFGINSFTHCMLMCSLSYTQNHRTLWSVEPCQVVDDDDDDDERTESSTLVALTSHNWCTLQWKSLYIFFYPPTKSHSFNHYFQNLNSLRCGRTYALAFAVLLFSRLHCFFSSLFLFLICDSRIHAFYVCRKFKYHLNFN